jgi:hypothetical protein
MTNTTVPTPPRMGTVSVAGIIALVGGLAAVVAIFLPWIRLCLDFGGFAADPVCVTDWGFRGFGIAAAASAIAAATLGALCLTFQTRQSRFVLAIGILGCAGVIAINTVMGFTGQLGGSSPGIGVWLSLVATLLTGAGGVIALYESRTLRSRGAGFSEHTPPPPPP